MSWSSAADFWAMGGYGLYVWGSIGMCAVVLLAEIWAIKASRARLAREVQHDNSESDFLHTK